MKALLFLMTILWTPIIFAQSQNPLLLRDVNTAPVSSNPQQFLSIGNTTFFVAESRAYGQELWVIDAITEEVTLLNDILPGKNKSYIQELIAMNGTRVANWKFSPKKKLGDLLAYIQYW